MSKRHCRCRQEEHELYHFRDPEAGRGEGALARGRTDDVSYTVEQSLSESERGRGPTEAPARKMTQLNRNPQPQFRKDMPRTTAEELIPAPASARSGTPLPRNRHFSCNFLGICAPKSHLE